MRIEQVRQNSFYKKPSKTELDIISIIEKELAAINPGDRATIDYIVQEVLSRVKSEITNMNGAMGVVSVNGKNGVVQLTAANLKAEPAFTKKSAFNKDFGTTYNTITEGNDPRLSDAREPLTHKHDVAEIENIDNVINWNDKVLLSEALQHSHDNKGQLDRLMYTGIKQVLDLQMLDELEKYVQIDPQDFQHHLVNQDVHVNAYDKTVWNAKESVAGSTDKANKALTSAKEYTDSVNSALINNASNGYRTLKQIETSVSTDAIQPLQVVRGNINDTLMPHVNNQAIHLTSEEKLAIGAIGSKSDVNHTHQDYTGCVAFTSINDLI